MSKLAATRISLQLPPGAPSEETDTLVLTFRAHYIDLRVLRSSLSSSPQRVEVDEGFAGTLTHASPAHTRWTHVVDSNGSDKLDEGTFTLLPNGDEVEEGLTEAGGTYREVWRQVPVEAGAPAWFLESTSPSPSTSSSPSTKDTRMGEGGEKVFAARMGLYYLTMGQTGARGRGYSAQRWQLEGGAWRRVYKVGGMRLPEPSEVGEVREGEEVWVGGRGYVVREAYAI
ncbi:hypothetical protein GLOTRDRAFT_141312 [Gloeophyllum trabeum ATCC 11539]|uniref:Protein HRI1 n=1 Tax=Gloeophyllum trabeum (strain ATCC 11539 / FP-39264 / Madison 617) TaxID=670483 RepID=S7PTN9_GLOTA|nr:uncharacterized protein GLOTRDRAFT_141312 [Gloeophyllum trabeum ATCC 11539]EPQ50808.1 hypothetical protein GLOTRDRAFT_141312 [Gloeophyllum trabeum ATCC 11539]